MPSGKFPMLSPGYILRELESPEVYNIVKDEFEEMEKFFSKRGAISWSVDVPCFVGRLCKNMDFVLDLKEAAKFLKYGLGAGGHESTGDYTCVSHLCSVASDSSVSKCGFFENEPAHNQ